MKYIYLALALAGSAHAATFTGLITDTHCGGNHTMMKGQPDSACVSLCVKGSGQYALFDGHAVLKLSDQKNPARFAGQRVTVIGAYDTKSNTIKVISIEPGTAGESH